MGQEERIAWWQGIEDCTPVDQWPTEIDERVLLYVVHENAKYASEEQRDEWEGWCVGYWTDFNKGGWVWHGLCGTITHVAPLPKRPSPPVEEAKEAPVAQRTEQQPSKLTDAEAGLARSNLEEAWAAFDLLHEGIGDLLPPGCLSSQEQINADYGPTFFGYAQALVEAVAKALPQIEQRATAKERERLLLRLREAELFYRDRSGLTHGYQGFNYAEVSRLLTREIDALAIRAPEASAEG